MVYVILFSLVWVLGRLLFRLHVHGKENLPKDRGFVICPNHISAIDPVFVVIGRGAGRRLSIMGKEELFKNPVLGWIMRKVGVFPVERGKGDTGALDKAIADVQGGQGMLIFPEGTRSKTNEMGRFKSGAFVIAARTGADIIPCRIAYSTGRLRLFCRIDVVFGGPISMEEMGLTGSYTASALRGAKEKLREAISALPGTP